MTYLPKRAWIEFNRLQRLKSESKFIIDSSPFTNDEEIPTDFVFIGRIFPTSEPFNQTALQIEIQLSTEYPAKPPVIRFLTPVYHPNVEENGSRTLVFFSLIYSFRLSFRSSLLRYSKAYSWLEAITALRQCYRRINHCNRSSQFELPCK